MLNTNTPAYWTNSYSSTGTSYTWLNGESVNQNWYVCSKGHLHEGFPPTSGCPSEYNKAHSDCSNECIEFNCPNCKTKFSISINKL